MATDQARWHFAHVDSRNNEVGENVLTINAVEDMDADALSHYRRDKRSIAAYFESIRLTQSVRLNLQEFLEAIVHYGGEFLETRQMGEQQLDEISLNLSRLLLNILSMFRALLDHSATSLSREFGKNSSQLDQWKSKLSKIYDESIEYRFFYKLRNYAQHVGVPPIRISFSDSAKESGISFGLGLSRDVLLEQHDVWGAVVRAELESGPDTIPVINFLQEWSISFNELEALLLDIKREAADPAATRIANHRNRLKLPQSGQVCVVCIPTTEDNPKNLDLNLDWLPEQKALQILDVASAERHAADA
ncbi:MAG: hypothetical protein WCZ86_14060 [Desulfurivibrionaceae bacterium]|jgi:hypothetical protein